MCGEEEEERLVQCSAVASSSVDQRCQFIQSVSLLEWLLTLLEALPPLHPSSSLLTDLLSLSTNLTLLTIASGGSLIDQFS